MLLRNWAGHWVVAWASLTSLTVAQQTPATAPSNPGQAAPVNGVSQADPPSPYRFSGQPAPGTREATPAQPPYQVAERSTPVAPDAMLRSGAVPTSQPNEHPLMPALRWAREGMREIEKFQDYSAIMVKRERHDGKPGNYEYMFVKIRQKPLSVYMYFLDPPADKGTEVIYIVGQNNGKMWAHPPGLRNKIVGTVSLDPNGPIAMRNNHYPITEIGLMNLVQRLLEVGEHDAQYGECEVKFLPGAKINGRTCTCLQVVHPVPRRNFLFHMARIFVDDELRVPIRYESYDWPRQAGGEPELIEEYTYLNLKVNNGFTDADFDIRNPNYGFKR